MLVVREGECTIGLEQTSSIDRVAWPKCPWTRILPSYLGVLQFMRVLQLVVLAIICAIIKVDGVCRRLLGLTYFGGGLILCHKLFGVAKIPMKLGISL